MAKVFRIILMVLLSILGAIYALSFIMFFNSVNSFQPFRFFLFLVGLAIMIWYNNIGLKMLNGKPIEVNNFRKRLVWWGLINLYPIYLYGRTLKVELELMSNTLYDYQVEWLLFWLTVVVMLIAMTGFIMMFVTYIKMFKYSIPVKESKEFEQFGREEEDQNFEKDSV